MTMKSFRDVLGSVAAARQTAATPFPVVPQAAPVLESLVAKLIESDPTAELVESVPVQPKAQPASAAKTTGFSAMLQRIAGPETPIVSVIDEAVTPPTQPTPPQIISTPTQVDESLLGGFASGLNKLANKLDGSTTHDDLHSDVHEHLAKAADALARAHSIAKEAHANASDPVHRAHLQHVLGSIEHSFHGVSGAKEASNLGQHHYKSSTGQLA